MNRPCTGDAYQLGDLPCQCLRNKTVGMNDSLVIRLTSQTTSRRLVSAIIKREISDHIEDFKLAHTTFEFELADEPARDLIEP